MTPTPQLLVRSLLDLAVRATGFVAIYLVVDELVELPGDDGLGKGLLAFATFGLVSVCWGAIDGWSMSYPRLAVAWLGAGVLTGLAMSVLVWLPGDGSSTDLVGDIVSDFVATLPVVLGFVAVPALVAGALLLAIRPRPQVGPEVTPPRSGLPR